MFACKDTTIGN